jgi:hypothetical protein
MSFELLRQAINDKRCVSASYKAAVRHFAPHCLGYGKRGEMNVLGFQYGGESSGSLPSWRCFRAEELTGVVLNSDPWVSEGDHSKPNSCVATVLAQVDF